MTAPMFSVSSSLAVNRDDKLKWLESYRLADHMLILMDCWRKCPPAQLVGDEFNAVKGMLSFVMASSGTHIDSVLTASSMEELFEIQKEFQAICKSRCT